MKIKKYFSSLMNDLLQSCLCVIVLLLFISPGSSSLSYGEDSRLDVIRVEIGPVDTDDRTKEPVTDFYLNGGEEKGISLSMVLDVYRDKIVRRTAGDNFSISVPVGQVKVLKVYKDIAIARIESIASLNNTPVLQYQTVMLGDYAVLKGGRELQGDFYGNPASGIKVSSELLFSINGWKLKPEAKKVLSRIHDHYNKAGDKRIIVEGYTCSLGPEKYNLELSGKRARSVREYFLKEKGLSADMISTEAYGEEKPAASNKTKEGRVKNRRVNIRFLPPSK